MKIQKNFELFMDMHKESLRLAFLHGNFEDMCKFTFQHGFERGWEDGVSDGMLMAQEDEE